MLKLYHYIHCPFCVRVRMGFGLLKIPYESIVVSYDDELTPLNLTSVKMLPIMQDDSGRAMNESLDILRTLDEGQKLSFNHVDKWQDELEKWLDQIGGPVHNLAMPYWIWTPEFDQRSRVYFQTKKEKKRGPFHLLVQKRAEFESKIQTVLTALEKELTPFYQSDKLTAADLMLAAHLWGLYVVPEFQFLPKMHHYLQTVKELCHFNYHEDYWREASFSARRSE